MEESPLEVVLCHHLFPNGFQLGVTSRGGGPIDSPRIAARWAWDMMPRPRQHHRPNRQQDHQRAEAVAHSVTVNFFHVSPIVTHAYLSHPSSVAIRSGS